jgi:L-aspartate oxidase
VIVCGSGIAGCLVALRVAPLAPVLMVTKRTLGSGSTRRAQGGIAAAIGPDDGIQSHLHDTIAAGAGICDHAAAEAVCAHGPACVAELMELGVAFDGGDPPALGLEAAHSTPRIVHVDGDATGRGVMAALTAAVRAHTNISILEETTVRSVLRRDGVASGVECIDASGRTTERHGRAVVLATGGIGQLFPFTTNPTDATGDGIAIAARAGAALADMEMVQFHPTALAVGGSPLPLISEAVRGAGAILRDTHGVRFLDGSDGLTELSPRDQVARAIYRRALDTGGPVSLDLRHLDDEQVVNRFPGISAICREHGLDLARDLIPVTPAAHYFMGGVLTDTSGRSSLPGLLAIGECASTGAHGANRLASNSLLEGALMADRASRDVLASHDEWPQWPLGSAREPLALGPAAANWRQRLGEAMWSGAGLERSLDTIAHASTELANLVPPPDFESANMLQLGEIVLGAAAYRDESRGAHFRQDYPATDPGLSHRIAWCDGDAFDLPVTKLAPMRSAA